MFYLSEVLGDEYLLLKEENMTAIHLAIFVHKSIFHEFESIFFFFNFTFKDIQSNYIKTGFGNIFGNKGAVAICFRLKEKNILIINSHFTCKKIFWKFTLNLLKAGQSKIENRNYDFIRINNLLRFPNSNGLSGIYYFIQIIISFLKIK